MSGIPGRTPVYFLSAQHDSFPRPNGRQFVYKEPRHRCLEVDTSRHAPQP